MAWLIGFLLSAFIFAFSVPAWKDFFHWIKGEEQELPNTPAHLACKLMYIVSSILLVGTWIWVIFFLH